MIMHHAVKPIVDTDIEKEANAFAAEFLMPAKDVAPNCMTFLLNG